MKKTMTLISKFTLAAVFITLFAAAGSSAMAQDVAYVAGTHYVELPVPIKTRAADKIEVAEYFSYGCPHCYQIEPMISSWKQQLGNDVEFIRTPAVWNKDYEVYAQTYYTAQALSVLDQVHVPLFDAIHSKRRRLNDPEQMAGFFAELGLDPMAFARTYSSFGVRASTQQAEAKGRAYRSGGVPALIVNGKYRVEAAMAGGNAEMLEVVGFLIKKERLFLKQGG
jgi:protein dithiol oxidoreductase (disulfide-forming)